MSGLIRDTRDQPGLEVVPPNQEELGYQHGNKDAAYINELPETSTPRICGLSTRTFWIAFAFVIVVLGAAIGGGVGGGLSAAHKDKTVPTPPQQQQSTTLVSSSSTASTSSSTATSSATSTSSGIAPFSTQPGTYRIINLASDTAMDLFLGGTTNGTEIEAWDWDQNAPPENNIHQLWQIASVGNGAIIILNTQTNSYVTAPSDLTAGINPTTGGSNAQVYGGVPGSPADTHTQWVIVPNSDNSISFSSIAYPSKLLDLAGGNIANGTAIILWEKDGGVNQEWRLVGS